MTKDKYEMRKTWGLGFLGFLGIPGIAGLFVGRYPWLIFFILFFLWFIPVKKSQKNKVKLKRKRR
jgi:hypothetical protein